MDLVSKKLVLGYAGDYYPSFFVSKKGTLKGYMPKIFKFFAEYYGLKPIFQRFTYDNGDSELDIDFNGIFGQLRNGTIFTIADGSALTEQRIRLFKYSSPAYYSKVGFYEAPRSRAEEESPLQFFTVFRASTLVLLIFCFGITPALRAIVYGVHIQSTPEPLLSRRPLTMLVLGELALAFDCISLALVIYYHAAGFRGNNIVLIPPAVTKLDVLLSDIRSSRRQIIAPYNTEYYEEELRYLYDVTDYRDGEKRVEIVAGERNLLERLCTDKKTVARLFESQLLQASLIKHPCFLNRIIIDRVLSTSHASSESAYYYEQPYFFFYHKNTSNRIINQLNRLIEGMFSVDQVDRYWNTKYMEKVARLTKSVPSLDYSSMSLRRVRLLLLLKAIGFVVSTSVFILELVFGRFTRHREHIHQRVLSILK